MNIDAFLNNGRRLKHKVDETSEKYKALENIVINPRDPLNLGDGIPARNRNENGHETKLLAYIDAGNEWSAARDEYKHFRDQLEQAIYNMVHWQALIINQIYIYNLYFGYDEMRDVDEILKTKDPAQIRAKLAEAKAALADMLRAQGVEIE